MRNGLTQCATSLAGAGAVLGGIAYGAAAWAASEHWLQSRSVEPSVTPEALGLRAESVEFTAIDGVSLAAWLIPAADVPPPDSSRRGTIVLLHGKTGGAASMLHHAPYLHAAGYHVLALDFRGRGRSEGETSGLGVLEELDAASALAYLRDRRDIEGPVGLMGFSLGACTAVSYAGSNPDVAGVVVEGVYADFPALLDYWVDGAAMPSWAARRMPVDRARRPAFEVVARAPKPGLSALTRQLLERRVGVDCGASSAVEGARRLEDRPLLVIEDEFDVSVPPESGAVVAAAGGSVVQCWLAAGAEHGEGHQVLGRAFEERVLTFWKEAFVRA
jgi:pimeloyl-ACP methyl ester carboxylesterase